MAAQALTGTCAGVPSLSAQLTRTLAAGPGAETSSLTVPAQRGEGSSTIATHSYWGPHTVPSSPPGATISQYWPPKTGQLWPRGRRNSGPS